VTEKLYARRDPVALMKPLMRHLAAMTEEGLHEKGDIALELAWRDAQIEQLADRLKQIEEWARWKCRGGTCGVSRAERGAHRNGCPVVELGLDQESDQ